MQYDIDELDMIEKTRTIASIVHTMDHYAISLEDLASFRNTLSVLKDLDRNERFDPVTCDTSQ